MEQTNNDKPLKGFNVILVGSHRVGGTALVLRLAENTFKETELKTVIGVDYMTRNLEVDGRVVKIRIWDY